MEPAFLAKLLKAARAGDEEAFTRLVEATREKLFWTARRMLGSTALAEEVLQDAYLALWGLQSSKLPDNPEAWLWTATTRKAIDHLRLEEHKHPHFELQETDLPQEPVPGPVAHLGALEAEERLEAALAELPPKMRAAIVLKTEGYDYDEIAALLGTAESTVRNQVLQARRRLAPLFGR